MLGVVYAFGCAVASSLKAVLLKKNVKRDELVLSGSFRLFAALLYAPFLLLAFTPPTLLTVVGGVFNALLTFLVTKAVKRGDLSLVSPIYAFTPIITFVISWLLLGEAATLWALLGIVLVVVGSFILNIKHGWNALTRLFTHAGTRTHEHEMGIFKL
jgi:drug/metabolite transporter (DMT)-like permease